jgi:hypothetical protein
MVQSIHFFGAFWDKGALNLVLIFIKIYKIDARTATYLGEFSKQH